MTGGLAAMAKQKQQADEPHAPPQLAAEDEQGPDGFLIVGIGASAGGFEAFQQVLRELPSDLGAAVVLVQHMAPQHESSLAGLLASSTSLPVVQIHDDTLVEPNHIYVIPPNRNLVLNGRPLS